MMLGAWSAKQFVNRYLEQDLPRRLTKYRNEWNLDDEILGDPKKYLPYEPVAVDAWPMVDTVITSTQSMDRVDYDLSLNPEYRVTYQCRTYVWAKGDNSELATQARDCLLAVVREAMLDHQCLNRSDAESRSPMIDEGTFREEYSDLTAVKGERMMAAGYLAYDLTLTEIVEREPVGVLSDLDITGLGYVEH
jgi:hypothetical protein